MNFDEYQNRTDDTNIFSSAIDELLRPIERALPEDNLYAYHQLHKVREMLNYFYAVLGLTSEAGELAGVAKKWLRDSKEPDTMDEAGDVLYYVAQVARQRNINLSDVAKRNNEKLADRKRRGKIGGDGDER